MCHLCIHDQKASAKKLHSQYHKRVMERDDPETMLAFKLWQIVANHSYLPHVFRNSRNYDFFLRYAKYLLGNNLLNPFDYTKWLLGKRIGSKLWFNNSHHSDYIKSFLNTETPRDAFNRSLNTLSSEGLLGTFFEALICIRK